jgi:hypothetical protein
MCSIPIRRLPGDLAVGCIAAHISRIGRAICKLGSLILLWLNARGGLMLTDASHEGLRAGLEAAFPATPVAGDG